MWTKSKSNHVRDLEIAMFWMWKECYNSLVLSLFFVLIHKGGRTKHLISRMIENTRERERGYMQCIMMVSHRKEVSFRSLITWRGSFTITSKP